MDLDFIQSNLSDFATFGKNIGNALQGIPEFFSNLSSFIDNFDALSSVTEGAVTPAEEA